MLRRFLYWLTQAKTKEITPRREWFPLPGDDHSTGYRVEWYK